MIISLHTPKAGGSSFKVLLENYFKNHFFGDYSDKPINTSEVKRKADAIKFDKKFRIYTKHVYRLKKVECIHGHFLPYKYASLLDDPNVNFITWLRDPLERLASHYYYWQRAYDRNKSIDLQKKVIESKWTLEEFCFSKEMKNFYNQFLWNFPLENFSFIGIVEQFDEDCRFFTKNYLGNDNIVIPNINVNPIKTKYFTDKVLIKELKEFHSRDYEIYETALSMRENRNDDKS